MKEKIFESGEVYDLMYKDKDYKGELDFIESLFPNKPKEILELGCGTGNYTKELLKKGYSVSSLDLSKSMLETAQKKVPEGNFVQGDLRNFKIEGKYDACLILFAVLDYITENNDLKKVFQNIKEHLNPEGFLIFDVWNGLAVLNEKPEKRVKEVENDEIKVIRYAVPKLNVEKHICDINYRFIISEKEKKSHYEREEKHRVRFFFPQELKKYLEDAGFNVVGMCKFFDKDGGINENCWNIVVVARLRN